MQWRWSSFENDAIPMFFGHTLPLLLMRLFGLNNCWRSFSMLLFFLRLLVGFHGFSFVLSLPSSTLQFFTKPSGPMFLQGFFANHRSNHAIFAMYRSSLVREFFNTDRLGWDLICFSQVKAGTLNLAPKLNTGIYDWLEFYQLNLFLFFRKRY